jgi:hypothetical protein
MSFARSSIQSKSARRWAIEEPIEEPTVGPAEMERLSSDWLLLGRELVAGLPSPKGWDCVMHNRTLPQIIRDEVAILELFNSLAAPIRDMRTPPVPRPAASRRSLTLQQPRECGASLLGQRKPPQRSRDRRDPSPR